MAKAYSVNGVTVLTLKEVAELLELPRVAGKDILAGQYPGVEIVDTDDLATMDDVADEQELQDHLMGHGEELLPAIEPELESTVENLPDTYEGFMEIVAVGDAPKDGVLTNKGEEPTDDTLPGFMESVGDTVKETATDVDETTTEEETAPPVQDEPTEESDTEYPEIGYFEDDKAMKKYIKKLSNDELAEWCELEGATWKHNDHEAINRMRQAMAIKALHFPDTAPKAGKAKSKSKYADFTTEDLVQMAIDNDVEIKDDKGDMRILRMYAIMALRKAGLIS